MRARVRTEGDLPEGEAGDGWVASMERVRTWSGARGARHSLECARVRTRVRGWAAIWLTIIFKNNNINYSNY